MGEKLAIRFGIPMILRVAAALRECPCITSVYAATSPHTPQTRRILRGHAHILDTAGAGYPRDMMAALAELSGPTLIVPGDMPLLDHAIISYISQQYDNDSWTSIITTEGLACLAGVSQGMNITYRSKRCRYTGISMVNAIRAASAPQRYLILDDIRLVVNVNLPQDCILLGAAHHTTMH